MSTVGQATQPATAARNSGIPMTRLIVVELRKLTDTRAGLWLLIATTLAAVAVVTASVASTPDGLTLADLLPQAALPVSLLLPVLGILAMTGEWSRRTALTTFTLTPARGRVLAAKLAAAFLVGLVAAIATIVVSAVGVAADGTPGGVGWNLGFAVLSGTALRMVIAVLLGSAFGALLHNPALAIVTYFVAPQAYAVATVMIKSLHGIADWANLGATTAALLQPGMTAGQWARLGTSILVWLVVPLTVGLFRTLRREVG